MFVRNVDLALERAEASCSRVTWQMMTASERSAAIYRELQALDAQSINDGSYIPTRSLRRRDSRARPYGAGRFGRGNGRGKLESL